MLQQRKKFLLKQHIRNKMAGKGIPKHIRSGGGLLAARRCFRTGFAGFFYSNKREYGQNNSQQSCYYVNFIA